MSRRAGLLKKGKRGNCKRYVSLFTLHSSRVTLPSMISKVKIYSDGGARGNPGPAAIGVMICDEKDEMLQEHNEVIGETTNNVAEYTAVIVGLEMAKALGAREVDYYVDSELVAYQ